MIKSAAANGSAMLGTVLTARTRSMPTFQLDPRDATKPVCQDAACRKSFPMEPARQMQALAATAGVHRLAVTHKL